MNMPGTGSIGRTKPNRLETGLLAAALAVATAGCDSLLEVENPNNVVQQDLENAEAVTALVNGAVGLTSDAIGETALSSATLTDELLWTGSQNWAGELDRGTLTNPAGRSDDLTNWYAEAVWTAEEAVRMVTEVQGSQRDLMLANMYSGIMHMMIADNMEDFAFSDRTEVSAPVGEANMVSVYDTAIVRLETALGLASGAELQRIRALLARAHWGRALWPKMQADPTADPLVNDPDANAWAQAVLDEVAGDDWSFDITWTPNVGESPLGSWVNSRQEFVFGPDYVIIGVSGKAVAPDEDDADGDGDVGEAAISLLDPVDGIPDQALQETVTEFIEAFTYPSVSLVSERELHLILAEADLAAGSPLLAVDHINAVRALKGGHTPYDPGTDPVTPLEMLRHERRVNLFIMPSRRMWDMYRFGEESPQWGGNSDASVDPGQVWVIGQSERISNCYIVDPETCS